MKAHLMFRDRDFDPENPLPANSQELIQDLELNTLFMAMAQKDNFLFKTAKQALLDSLVDVETIRYRQDILKDCLKNPATVREIYRLSIASMEAKRTSWLGIFSHYPSGIVSSAVKFLEMLVFILKDLKKIADEQVPLFSSEGFTTFFKMIQKELDDEYIATIQGHLKELHFSKGVLLSARLGQGNEGTDYLLCKTNPRKRNWIKETIAQRTQTYSYTLDPRDEGGARALSDLRDRGLNEVANALGQATDHIESFLNMLRQELAFYIGCLNLHDYLVGLNVPITIPEVFPVFERRHAYQELYDICLALTMEQKVVGNEGNADGKDLVMVTGANQGGKSTYLRSIGLAQVMMQCGMFVPAQTFSANVCSGIFTHYKRKEDVTMKSGKLDEELSRMNTIVGQIKPNAMVLFNESFAATNEREGSEIARQILRALLEAHVEVFFVTHLYDLAYSIYRRNLKNTLFLRAERLPDGTRTFKLIVGEPLETSYGPDLYARIFEGAEPLPIGQDNQQNG